MRVAPLLLLVCLYADLKEIPESSCRTACRKEKYDSGIELKNKCRCFDDWDKRVITEEDRITLPVKRISLLEIEKE